MKGKGVCSMFILVGVGLLLTLSTYANDLLLSDCGSLQSENSRRLCQQLDRIELKLDRALQLLETGNGGNHGGGHGRYYTPAYTCKIKINNSTYEGFGSTVSAARTDVTEFCKATGYSESTCINRFVGCDIDAFNESGHYKCEVMINNQTFQGLGISKTEARSMAFALCKQADYNSSTCYGRFSRCYPVPLN
ncbi:MAG: double-stranded RNA binding motif domain-containing protein [Bdellovibrionota bacterium]